MHSITTIEAYGALLLNDTYFESLVKFYLYTVKFNIRLVNCYEEIISIFLKKCLLPGF